MQSNVIKQSIIPILIIVIGFGLIFPLSNFVENVKPALPEGFADSDLELEGSNLKGYALGFEGLIADIYWMKSLQYIGTKVVESKEAISIDDLTNLNPRLLYPYLDNATTLDPQFIDLYTYGAVVLPAINKEQAIKLVQKGVKNNPDEWRLYQHLGYIYWRLGQYENASEVYKKGAAIEGSPPFMSMMATKMSGEGKSRETARNVYQQLLEQTQDSQLQEFAELNLLGLDSEEEREEIDKVLQNFKAQNDKCVENLRQILPNLRTVKLPNGREFSVDSTEALVDPAGTPYLLDKESCRVKLDQLKTRIPRKIDVK